MDAMPVITDYLRSMSLKKKTERIIDCVVYPYERVPVWGIRFRGKPVRLYNGKSEWRTKKIALIALSHKIKLDIIEHMREIYEKDLTVGELDTRYKKLIHELEEDGILTFEKLRNE